MKFLELKVPPAVVALLCAGAMWGLAVFTPTIEVHRYIRIPIAALICACGLVVMLAAVLSFRRAKTTIDPLKPQKASMLVTSGVYRYTRNPMYLGMFLILLAWAVFLSSPMALMGVAFFWLYIDRFQICPEEKVLVVLFGDAFTSYASQVRRWF